MEKNREIYNRTITRYQFADNIINEACREGHVIFNGKRYKVYRNRRGIFLPINQDITLQKKVFWKRLFKGEQKYGDHYFVSYYDMKEIFPDRGGYISNDFLFLWEPVYHLQPQSLKEVLEKIMELW